MSLRLFVSMLTFALGACAKKTDSDVNIVGGSTTTKYPGVIRFLTDLESGRFCTGVVVSETTALVAGHCIKNMTIYEQIYAERPSYLGSGGHIRSNKIYFWPALGNLELLNEKTIARDLAVVVFNDAPFKAENGDNSGLHIKIAPEILNGTRTSLNSPITMVGYGANELGKTKGARDSLGTKRVGTNEIAGLGAGFYTVKSKISEAAMPNRAFAAEGDAGAPLLDAQGQLIGIGAGFMLTDADLVVTEPETDEYGYISHSTKNAVYAFNAFVDLSSEVSRRLLAYAAWQGRPGQGHVKIPGVNPTSEVSLTDEDNYWTELNPHLNESLKDTAKENDQLSTWIAMTGGGGFAKQNQGLALQGLSPSCSPMLALHEGGASDNDFMEFQQGLALQGLKPSCVPTSIPRNGNFEGGINQTRSLADQWRNANPAQRTAFLGGQPGFAPGAGAPRPSALPQAFAPSFGGASMLPPGNPMPFGGASGPRNLREMQTGFFSSPGFGGPMFLGF